MTFDAAGYVLASEVDGAVQVKSYLTGNPPIRVALTEDLAIVGKGNEGSARQAAKLRGLLRWLLLSWGPGIRLVKEQRADLPPDAVSLPPAHTVYCWTTACSTSRRRWTALTWTAPSPCSRRLTGSLR